MPPSIDSSIPGAGDGSNNRVAQTAAPRQIEQAPPQPSVKPAPQQPTPQQQPAEVETVTQGGISTEIPREYQSSPYAEVYPLIKEAMEQFKPMTEEELKKLRRRQKIEGVISGVSDGIQSVANLIATSQYAPNMYNAKEGMSAKAKERFDKAEAERKDNLNQYLNYAMTLGKMKGDDQDRGFKAWLTQQQLLRDDRRYDDGRQDREADVAYRDKVFDAGRKDREDDVKFRDKQFDENKRQFNVSLRNSRRGGGGGGGAAHGNGYSPANPHMLGDGTYGYVDANNWENDKYINQLFHHASEWVKRNGTPGAQQLFLSEGHNISDRLKPNQKRQILNHYFNQGYGSREGLGSEIMIFDANYGKK